MNRDIDSDTMSQLEGYFDYLINNRYVFSFGHLNTSERKYMNDYLFDKSMKACVSRKDEDREWSLYTHLSVIMRNVLEDLSVKFNKNYPHCENEILLPYRREERLKKLLK